MQIVMFCGKGGVGKTTLATAAALRLAHKGESTILVDYDEGHSVASTLGIDGPVQSNALVHGLAERLALCVIDGDRHVGIADHKAQGGSLAEYLEQFPDDTGIVPIADMVNAFFGIPTDPNTLFKFAKLVWLLETARADKYQNVVIDVEPTAGLGRLLTTAQMTVRCLRNLHNKGKFSLAALGLAWPDVSNYLRGEYIKQAEKYAERLERAVAALEAAKFFLVCTPEAVPMRQMFQVEQLVERFGGHASGYVVNNHRGEVAEEQILLAVEDENCPVAVIEHDSNLQTVTTGELRRLLCQIGKEIERALPLREEAVPAQ